MEVFQHMEIMLNMEIMLDMEIIPDTEFILDMEAKHHTLQNTKIGRRKQIYCQVYNIYTYVLQCQMLLPNQMSFMSLIAHAVSEELTALYS